jgi:hypothetical protein
VSADNCKDYRGVWQHDLTGREPDRSSEQEVWRLDPNEDSIYHLALQEAVTAQNCYAELRSID